VKSLDLGSRRAGQPLSSHLSFQKLPSSCVAGTDEGEAVQACRLLSAPPLEPSGTPAAGLSPFSPGMLQEGVPAERASLHAEMLRLMGSPGLSPPLVPPHSEQHLDPTKQTAASTAGDLQHPAAFPFHHTSERVRKVSEQGSITSAGSANSRGSLTSAGKYRGVMVRMPTSLSQCG
jgi:hypothetical protein